MPFAYRTLVSFGVRVLLKKESYWFSRSKECDLESGHALANNHEANSDTANQGDQNKQT